MANDVERRGRYAARRLVEGLQQRIPEQIMLSGTHTGKLRH
jgi:hypothetical protein